MKSGYNPNRHHRKSIRLKGYDYSGEGLYFITICCQNRTCFFGKIANGQMQMNAAGQMIDAQWADLPNRFLNIHLHEWVVMPNHFHGIIEIVGHTVGAPLVGAQNTDDQNAKGRPQGHTPTADDGNDDGEIHFIKSKTIGDILDAFKSITTVEYIRGVKNAGWQQFDGKLWQRNYWEHIIRNEPSFNRIAHYICTNPQNWKDDKFYDQDNL